MSDEKIKDNQAERIGLRVSTFRCSHCDMGAEKFSDVFVEGKCVSCGAPAGVIVEISRPEDVKKIERSVMVVYTKADEEKAKQIMTEMRGRGIDVIDPAIIVDNEAAGNKVNTLSFLVSTAKLTLVIPSKEISDDPLVATAVETGLMGGNSKIAPLYPDPSYLSRSSFLDTRAGVAWQGSVDHSMDKTGFLDYLTRKK